MKMALLSWYHFATAKLTPMAYNKKKNHVPELHDKRKEEQILSFDAL